MVCTIRTFILRATDNTEFKIDARTTDVISLSLRKMFPIYV